MSEVFVNLHTHTFRCNHASGVERDYIERALADGITKLGFADHAPYVFDGEYYSGFRMRPELQEDYVTALQALREEYRGRIEIKIGYEAEYYPRFFDRFLEMICRYEVDYLILGQHFIWNEMDGVYSGNRTTDEGILREYVDTVLCGISTGKFTYIAHPDLCNFAGEGRIFEKHYCRLIEGAKGMGIPLEINLLGIRDGRPYPHDEFFRLCGEIGAEVCIGSDAHSADVVADLASREKAMDMVYRFGLKLNADPILRPVM